MKRKSGKRRGMIFDLDGTLIDSIDCWTNVSREFLSVNHIEDAPSIVTQNQKMSIRDVAQYYIDNYGLPYTREQLLALWCGMLVRVYRRNVSLKPHAKELLSWLNREGYALCVATETEREIVDAALMEAGIRDYFEFVITASEVGKSKHEPDLFLEAAARLASPPKDTVVVEDSPYAVKTAKQAGFLVCAVYEKFHSKKQKELIKLADYYVKELGELPALLMKPPGHKESDGYAALDGAPEDAVIF